MDRRKFLKGVSGAAVAVAVTAAIPAVAQYEYVTYGTGQIWTREGIEGGEYRVLADKRAKALARSMMQTKEIVARNVFNRAFT